MSFLIKMCFFSGNYRIYKIDFIKEVLSRVRIVVQRERYEMDEDERTCPVCGVSYSADDEIQYIKGYGMCYHCFCEFDDEISDWD